MKKLILLFLFICCFHTFQAQSLTQRLDSLLNNPLLKTSEVGITVFDLTEGKSLYRYQDEKLYRPASTEKVITSVTALAQLGNEYTMDTRLQYTGIIENDTLKGSLYLIGGFDPELMEIDLDSLVDAVAQSGIRYITDTLAADVSMMDSVYWGPGWSWDDVPNAFQPYLSPLMLNRGCVEITVSPTQKDSLPEVTCLPVSDYYRINNQGISRNPLAGKLKITRNWLHNDNQISISGNVMKTITETLSIYTSKDFFFHTFIQRLKQRGITAATTTFATCPLPTDSVNVTSLYVHHRPIRQVLKQALKESDNLCAESMFYHLARKYANRPQVGWEDGTDAINDFMKTALGFNPDSYRIADGSGVSLYNYISPRLLLEYLKYAYYHPEIFHSFYESLPIAGIDGTLQYRMKKTAAYRKVHAKTGSVTGVSSLAGYAKASNGHQLAFVIINQNVMKLRQARIFQDRICQVLCQ